MSNEEVICQIPFQPWLSEAVEWALGGVGMTRDTTGAAVVTLPRLHPHRLNLNKSRLLARAAKGFLGKPLTKAPESAPGSQSLDYVPLVSAPDPRPQAHTQQRGCPLLPLHQGKKT